MSPRYGKRHTKIEGQFAPRLIEMLESSAMSVLSLSARRVINRIEIELGHHGGTDNGKLPVVYADFVKFGMDRHAIAPAIREAVALGLIEVTERGRAGNAEFRTPSLYRLTFRHSTREGPTDEWRNIKTIAKAKATARAARMVPSAPQYRAPRKQKASGGKRHVSVGKPHTENSVRPVRETNTTPLVGKTLTTLDIWVGEPEIPAFLDRRAGRSERPQGASEAKPGNECV